MNRTPEPDTQRRDPFFDNARAVLITLVVVGHALEPIASASAHAMTVWIYSFHMPAFVFVCGVLARTYRGTPRQASRVVTALLVPYAVFQVVHRLMRTATLDADLRLDLLTPGWTLWFLLALAMWRLLVPVFTALRFPVVTTVAISILAPLMVALDQTMSMGRVLSFAPFFVVGLLAEGRVLDRLQGRAVRVGAVAVLVASFAAVVAAGSRVEVSAFLFSTSYAARDLSAPEGMVIRAAALVAGAFGTAAVLALTARGQRWWTFVGQRSMYVYLLHPLALWGVRYLGWADEWTTPGHTVAVFVACVALTVLLASPPVVWCTRWIVDPPFSRLLVRPA